MDLLNTTEAAKRLKTSLQSVRDKVERGTLVGVKLKSGTRFYHYIPSNLLKFNPKKHITDECKVITINNLKGGTGKTTVAANLAFTLSVLGKRVLVVDMDPQANISHYFIDRNDIKNPITHLFQASLDRKIISKDDIQNSTITVKYQNSKIDLLPSSLKLSRTLEHLRHASSAAITKLDAILEKIKNQYDYIIVDTPPNVSIIMQMCLFASNMICIVTEAEEFAVEGMSDLIEEIHFVKAELADLKGYEMPFEIKALIINKVENINIHKDLQSEIFNIAKDLGTKVYTIPKSTKVKESQALKLPLFEYKEELTSGFKAGEPILDLAIDILGINDGN